MYSFNLFLRNQHVFGDLLAKTLNNLRSCRVLTSGRTQGTRGTNSQPQSSGLLLTAEPTVAGEHHAVNNGRGEYSGNVVIKRLTKASRRKECWARNRVEIGLSYRPAGLYRLAESIPWNRFLGSLKV
jgi:hypothetical protein